MSNQTENYIILKPIAERFNKIASEITDEEIKSLIKSELREQIRKIDFTYEVKSIIEEYLDENSDEVLTFYKNGLEERLK